ncbi:hypothetical protein [Rhodococcus sp. OK302]|uniref:hypothetical protein n=1 Tax=Rhodococcus sp. OK302 TaxID=1882769 RepID=UPI000B93DFC4|nr:hypothetical protein [Rhodococcus sp. OK302]OYD61061.1 hypothetical protein BDB13_5995 [Rhodococcus sp. OK302]
MTDPAENAIAALRAARWMREAADDSGVAMPLSRYEAITPDFLTWWTSFARLSSADETVWFLSASDYVGADGDVFAWNEFELISLDAAETAEEASAVVRFWDRHLPILLSVRNGYSFLALVTAGAGAGSVVHGEEPEFEESVPFTASFGHLLETLAGHRAPLNPRLWKSLFTE